MQFLGLVGKYNSAKLLKMHNRYVKHANKYLETIGVNQNMLLSALFLFSVHELIHINDF